MTIKAKHFIIEELVHPDIYKQFGEKSWQFLDVGLIKSIDKLREKFGPMIINTWHSDKMVKAYGLRNLSGLRPFDSKVGAKYSMHKFGKAADCLFINCTVKSAREYVLAHPNEFEFITAVESDVDWFHFDCRNTQPITVFKP